MRKTLFKIIGLALTIALLASVVIAVVPVSALSIISVTPSSSTISAAGVTYTTTFTGSLNLKANTDTITETFPVGTDLTALAAAVAVPTANTITFSNGVAPAADATTGAVVTVPARMVTITVPAGEDATIGNIWVLTIKDVTNPGTPGNYTVSISTSKEPTPVSSIAPPPTVLAISPTFGPITGGTTVTITGIDFVNGAKVTIGGNAATVVTFGSALTSITVITPSGTAGTQNVVVTNPDGQSGTLPDAFTYITPTTTVTISPTTTLVPTQTPTPTYYNIVSNTIFNTNDISYANTDINYNITPSTTVTPTSTPSPTARVTTTPMPIRVSTNWGIIGGSIAGGIAIIGLLVYFLWWRRRNPSTIKILETNGLLFNTDTMFG